MHGKTVLNIVFLGILFTVAFILFGFYPKFSAEGNTTTTNYKLKTVVLDAGHGGHDQGCSGKHSKEKEIALKIVLELGSYIEENFPEIKVIYTRKTDVFIELHERAAIANRNNADLFISVHCNAASASAKGTETFVMGLHKTEANLNVSKRENASILLEEDYNHHYDGFDPNSPESHIAFAIYQNAYLAQSILIAQKIEDQFQTRAKRYSRGVKQAGFLVLYKTSMPSVLVESGFLTNSNEEKFLLTDYGQELIASGIYRAFKEYKLELEGEQGVIKTEEIKIEPEVIVFEKEEPKEIIVETVEEKKKIINDEIVFKVQIFSSDQKPNLSKKPFNKLHEVETKEKKGIHKCFSGRFELPEKASEHKKELKKLGFKDAFVVAFKNNERISYKEAVAELNNK